VPAIRRAIWAIDKDQPIVRVAAMDDLVAASAAQRRFTLVVFAAFALAALLLAGTGVYGILAGSVAERRREIGVRSAMGASQAGILAGVVRQGLRLTAAGAAVGLVATLLGSQALGTMLFGISRLDPVTYLAVLALLAVVSVAASGAPAWRAARVAVGPPGAPPVPAPAAALQPGPRRHPPRRLAARPPPLPRHGGASRR